MKLERHFLICRLMTMKPKKQKKLDVEFDDDTDDSDDDALEIFR